MTKKQIKLIRDLIILSKASDIRYEESYQYIVTELKEEINKVRERKGWR